MLRFLANPDTARNAALGASLACVWLTAQFAQKVPKERPRAFTALSLLALNWAVLLLYYLPGVPEMELLSSISGFILIAVGGLLYRQAREDEPGSGPPDLTWLDTLPLFLFRSTVFGIGVYYLARRLFHFQWGWGTLALAIWGTFFSVAGYFAIWIGVVMLTRGRARSMKAALWFGLLCGVYGSAEVVYAGWYATRYWPAYSRYLALRARPDAPDFQRALPFEPQPDWPEAGRWSRLASSSERGVPPGEIIGLKPEPRAPESWPWLTYLFGGLKLGFTGALLALVLNHRKSDPDSESSSLHRFLERRLRLG
jgi:hypothetical protein